jgi:hypothetical protein
MAKDPGRGVGGRKTSNGHATGGGGNCDDLQRQRLAAMSESIRSTADAALCGGPAGNQRPEMRKTPDPVKDQGSWKVVAWVGIEPTTRGFSIRCSTN